MHLFVALYRVSKAVLVTLTYRWYYQHRQAFYFTSPLGNRKFRCVRFTTVSRVTSLSGFVTALSPLLVVTTFSLYSSEQRVCGPSFSPTWCLCAPALCKVETASWLDNTFKRLPLTICLIYTPRIVWSPPLHTQHYAFLQVQENFCVLRLKLTTTYRSYKQL